MSLRSYEQLLSEDPAWPEIDAMIRGSSRVTVLPRDPAAARACLEGLQVTTRSYLGAIAHETGGVLIDHGWLRLLGSGHPRFARRLGGWNDIVELPLAEAMVIGDDAIGGIFAINGGALGSTRGNIFYFAPDSLDWEDLGMGYGAFVGWAITGDVTRFYETSRWPGWEQEAELLAPDQMIHLWPPLWTKEGKDPASVSRKAVPARELYGLQFDLRKQL